MKTALRQVFPLIVSMLPLAAKASWQDGQAFSHSTEDKGMPLEVSEMKSQDGFSTQFWLIRDDHLATRWFQLDLHKLKAVTATRKYNPVLLALFFVNAGSREAFVGYQGRVQKIKMCNVTFDLKVIRPDGVVDNHPGLPVLQGEAPAPYLIKIAQAKVKITFDIEPIGVYKIKVVVHDHLRKVDIALERSLTVME